MADSRESLKRQNYFELKRDEIMAMDEYLQSPISEIDLRKMNEGGIASIENMTGPIGMAGGGSLGDSVMKMDTLIKIMELEGALSLKDSENLRKMSPTAIDKLYKNTFGGKK
jgi:hypothetical protein